MRSPFRPANYNMALVMNITDEEEIRITSKDVSQAFKAIFRGRFPGYESIQHLHYAGP